MQSRAGLFERVKIGPQLITRDAGSALNVQDAERRNAIPLGKRLRRYADALRQLIAGARRLDRLFQGRVFVCHA